MSDLKHLLEALSPDSPCGEDLEYDADFMALERDAQPKPEQSMGDSVVEAEEPDWRNVRQAAETLLERHRDLRTVFHLGRALWRTKGLVAGLQAFTISSELLDEFWVPLHPQLDADDDNDPTARINVLGAWADPDLSLSVLRTTPFIESSMAGNFSLRELRLARGDYSPPEGEQAPTLGLIQGAAGDMGAEELQAKCEALDAALLAANNIEKAFVENASTSGPSLQVFIDDLKDIRDFLRVSGQPATEDGEIGAEVGAADAAGAVGVAARSAPPGAISSREDASKRLDAVCVWFEKNEPSSPVPLLLRRAQRLVGKNFMDLIEDVASDGASQIRALANIPQQEDDD